MRRGIGRTDITVYPIGLGALQFSREDRPTEREALRVIRRAISAGLEFIDTADSYGPDENAFGHNERLVGKALAGTAERGRVVVATKVGLTRVGRSWTPDGRPDRLRMCCEASLRNLSVNAIPLYQLHCPDPAVPLAETVGAMKKLQEEGKVLHLGLSNVTRDEFEVGRAIARIECVQNECNPWTQTDLTNGLVDACSEHKVTYLPYRPLSGRKYHRYLTRLPVITELAQKVGASPYQVILSWLLSLGSHVIPIPGATKLASILENLAATRLSLDPQDARGIALLGRGHTSALELEVPLR